MECMGALGNGDRARTATCAVSTDVWSYALVSWRTIQPEIYDDVIFWIRLVVAPLSRHRLSLDSAEI
jgi:hypothetical protein